MLLALTVLFSIPAAGQTPAFEAASVKLNTSGDLRIRAGTRGRTYTAVNTPLRGIVAAAYELQFEGFRLVTEQRGLKTPLYDASIMDQRFDITATIPEAGTPRDVPAMLHALLVDRFKLAAHSETREAPVFALVLARRDGRPGPGLRQAALDCVAAAAAGRVIPPPEPGQPAICETEISDRIRGRGQPLSSLARMLTVFVQRRVVDRSGLSGGFDFDLQFEAGATGPTGPTVDAASNVITALQEQLGLRLESTRAPVEFVVVDRIEQPTPD